jgi:uncharacterized membrane protein
MDKLLVAVFDTESAAFDGVKALEDLNGTGEITLYADAVIAKDSNGKVEMKREPRGGLATVFGTVAGGLIGLLGGPVGAYAGAAAGAAGGAMVDLTRYGFGSDFVSEVAGYLIPGKAAVLAEVDETWTVPIDTRLAQLGGVVFRRATSEFVEDQLAREAVALDAEMDALDAEMAQADAGTRAALERQREHARQQAEALQKRVQENLDKAKSEMDAKIRALQEQAQHANAERKADIEKRIAETKADYESRRQKLEQARPLIKEALHP